MEHVQNHQIPNNQIADMQLFSCIDVTYRLTQKLPSLVFLLRTFTSWRKSSVLDSMVRRSDADYFSCFFPFTGNIKTSEIIQSSIVNGGEVVYILHISMSCQEALMLMSSTIFFFFFNWAILGSLQSLTLPCICSNKIYSPSPPSRKRKTEKRC